jgi:hypothetical protein
MQHKGKIAPQGKPGRAGSDIVIFFLFSFLRFVLRFSLYPLMTYIGIDTFHLPGSCGIIQAAIKRDRSRREP